jgi:segregation and condensation protein B
MGDWFDEDDEDFDLAAVEARHAELEAQEKLDAEMVGERPEASAGGIYPESDWEAIIEAVLFTMGNSVELRQLAIAINQCEGIAKQVVENLQKRYEQENRGMQIIALEDSYQMTTRARFYDNLILVATTPKKHILTDVILETLSIVAYKQPVTKAEITRIRGVASDHAVNRLVEYGLIAEVGRLDAPGRPALFATTEEFLRRFGVGSTTDLPTMKPEQEAEIVQEVQEEMQDYFPENQNPSGDEPGANDEKRQIDENEISEECVDDNTDSESMEAEKDHVDSDETEEDIPDTDKIEDDKKDADSEAAVTMSDEGESDGEED